MKLKKPWMIKLAGTAIGYSVRAYMTTVRLRTESFGQKTEPEDPTLGERFIYAFWHENVIATCLRRSPIPVTALISLSRDGELLSRAAGAFGVHTVRGSSSNGGVEAIDQLIEISKRSHLMIAPDGPRGPRHEVKRGLAYLAAWTGLRIIPLGIGFNRAWRANSWDKTAMPYPFSTAYFVAGPIIEVAAGLSKAKMEAHRLQIEQSIRKANDAAVAWAEGRTDRAIWPSDDVVSEVASGAMNDATSGNARAA